MPTIYLAITADPVNGAEYIVISNTDHRQALFYSEEHQQYFISSDGNIEIQVEYLTKVIELAGVKVEFLGVIPGVNA